MIICPMQKHFNQFLGKQTFAAGEYVPSKYNYYIDVDDGKLVYNAFSGVIAVLSDEQWDLLHQKNCLLASDRSEGAFELVINRLLVPPTINETEDYLALYQTVRRFSFDPAITSYTVLTTTGCNARCFYCFEQGFKADTMRKSTAEDLAAFMIRNCKGEKISIHWFGGEPLCNTSAIDTICTRLKEADVDFLSTMTSNGYAFTKEIISTAAKQWNLNSVQITLDGLHDEHNRRKNYITSSPDPFIQTIINIHELADAGIRVSIRLNFDSDNCNDIPALIDYLAKEFIDCKRVSAYPTPLFEDCNSWNPDRDNEEQKRLIQLQQEFSKEIRTKLLLSEKNVCRGFSTSHCGANNPTHRTINPNGSFSFCHNFSDTSVFGSIYDGVTDNESFNKWMYNDRLREMCADCIWLPECTSFDMCPVRKTYCQIEYENQIQIKLSRIYKQWKAKMRNTKN